MPSLFEVVYSGENAFHVTVNHFYTIDFTNAPEIKSILGFESDTLVKGLDNPKRYYMSSSCNQVVVSDGTDSHVLTLPTGYYTFSEFIEAVGAEMVKVLPLTSMTIEDDHVRFNDQSESWYFDRSSVDTTIDGFEWTPWFKLSPSVQNLCIERPVETQFDPANSETPPDETNDQGLGGHAYLDQCFVEYDWVMRTNTSFFILKPKVTYTMTNTDGSLFRYDSFYVTENTDTLMTLETLMNSCLSQLNAEYQKARNITSSHQKAISWTAGKAGDTVTWTANDYAPNLEFNMTAENMNVPMTINDDKRGGSFGPLYSKDSVCNDSVWVDTTHIVLGLEGYSETKTVTIEGGFYSALAVAEMIANGFNAIDGY